MHTTYSKNKKNDTNVGKKYNRQEIIKRYF